VKDRLLEWLSAASEATSRDPDKTQDHLATATFCYRLAKIMSQGQGKHAEAEAMLRKAVDIRTVELGSTDDLTTECSIALANVFRLQGKMSEAEVTMRKVCENMTISKGAQHEDTLLALATLSRVLVDRGNFEEAEKICDETLIVMTEKFGVKDKRTLETLVTLSQLADLRCDSDTAATRLKTALEGFEGVFGPDAKETLNVKADLAGFLAELENFDLAEALFREAYEKLNATLGGTHEYTIKAATGLSVLAKVREGLGPNYTPGQYASKGAVPSIPEEKPAPEAPVPVVEPPKAKAISTASVPQKKISFDPNIAQGGNSDVVEQVAEKLTSMREDRHEKIRGSSNKTENAAQPASRKHLRGWLEKLPIELSQRERERILKKGESGVSNDGSGVINPQSSNGHQARMGPKSLLLKLASGLGSFKEKKRNSIQHMGDSFSHMNLGHNFSQSIAECCSGKMILGFIRIA
jgi:tetratricopeptide (TPR) repeat protein